MANHSPSTQFIRFVLDTKFCFFFMELFRQRNIITELTRRDFRSRYLGSHLGIIWAFLHPLTYLFILWFVFEIAFHAKSSGDYPYALWLMVGLFPWFFFSEAVVGATASIIDHSFLVKKIIFPLGMLPIVKILSAMVIHLFLVVMMCLLFFVTGHKPSFYWLQLPYYLFSTMVLVLAIAWTTAAVAVYFRDMIQVVAMLIQFLFWFTPIVWSPDLLPAQLRGVAELNPVFYLVQGYRESFLSSAWFWESPSRAFIFWIVTLVLLFLGSIIFRRLRSNFGDVL